MFFNKEKDLIHRIVNLILIIWLVVAIFIFYSNTVDILIKEKKLTYDEYETVYCSNKDEENELISDCESDYQRYVINKKDDNYYYKKSLIYAIGNVIIVGSFLYLLNKKRD